jgi:hypothetical protein
MKIDDDPGADDLMILKTKLDARLALETLLYFCSVQCTLVYLCEEFVFTRKQAGGAQEAFLVGGGGSEEAALEQGYAKSDPRTGDDPRDVQFRPQSSCVANNTVLCTVLLSCV